MSVVRSVGVRVSLSAAVPAPGAAQDCSGGTVLLSAAPARWVAPFPARGGGGLAGLHGGALGGGLREAVPRRGVGVSGRHRRGPECREDLRGAGGAGIGHGWVTGGGCRNGDLVDRGVLRLTAKKK